MWGRIYLLTLPSFNVLSRALEVSSNYTFAQYKARFRRRYSDEGEEHSARQAIFESHLAEITAHNALGKSWKKGINHLTDLTESEMKQRLGYKPPWRRVQVASASKASSYLELSGEESACITRSLSCAESGSSSCCTGLICGAQGVCVNVEQKRSSMDWTELSPTAFNVLEQGQCGSCWAVAAAAVVQMHADIVTKNKFRKVLSPQSILSCTPNELSCGGEGGCKGATAELAFEYLASKGDVSGMLPIDVLPYNAEENSADCKTGGHSFLQSNRHQKIPMVTIQNYKTLETNNANAMMDALVNVGPVVASVVGAGLRNYDSGVLDECENFIIDHAVVMMGYGADKELADMRYWKVRNSWGPEWGERGFFRLQRFAADAKEPCGWDTDPSKGVACKDKAGPEGKYPDRQWLCGTCGILSDSAYPTGTHVHEALLEAESFSSSHAEQADSFSASQAF